MSAAVLAVIVPPPSGFPDGVLERAQKALATSLGGTEAGPYARTASFPGREPALRAAFGAAAALDRDAGRVTLVVCHGDLDRAWRLAIGLDREVVPHAVEVLATPGFVEGFAVPAGVGAFKAPGHGHGNTATVLVDYG